VIVEETDKIFAGFSMRSDQVLFGALAVLKELTDIRHVRELFDDARQLIEERIIEGGVDAEAFPVIVGRITADELIDDAVAGIVDLAKKEEIAFADAEGEFADGVTEALDHRGIYVHNGVDAKSVDVEGGNHIGIDPDQDIDHRSLTV
jgi:hypothetical protein